MVVDDNVDAAQMLAALLEVQGHAVCVEYDGKGALAHARRECPDVLLLDIGLPDMDGYELARRLRSQPESAGATLVALTGYGQSQDRKEAEQAGFDHYLVKPADMDQVNAVLAEAAPGARARASRAAGTNLLPSKLPVLKAASARDLTNMHPAQQMPVRRARKQDARCACAQRAHLAADRVDDVGHRLASCTRSPSACGTPARPSAAPPAAPRLPAASVRQSGPAAARVRCRARPGAPGTAAGRARPSRPGRSARPSRRAVRR
jgi:CheY-like chemotaxis protein